MHPLMSYSVKTVHWNNWNCHTNVTSWHCEIYPWWFLQWQSFCFLTYIPMWVLLVCFICLYYFHVIQHYSNIHKDLHIKICLAKSDLQHTDYFYKPILKEWLQNSIKYIPTCWRYSARVASRVPMAPAHVVCRPAHISNSGMQMNAIMEIWDCFSSENVKKWLSVELSAVRVGR